MKRKQNYILKKFKETFGGKADYTSGILKDQTVNEVIYFYKKEPFFTKSTMERYMNVLPLNNVIILLYNQNKNIY